MVLPSDLLSQFVKVTKSDKKVQNETTVQGTVKRVGDKTYVQLDGSDLLTPVSTTADTKDEERVTVMIKDHTAIVTGNLSSPSASSKDLASAAKQISEFEIVMAYKVSSDVLEAVNATIDSMRVKLANITNLEAVFADINDLQAKFADVEYLKAGDIAAITADIEKLEATFGTFTDISTEDLEALNANIATLKGYTADFTYVSTEVLEAIRAEIKDLDVKKISALQADIKDLDTNKLSANEADVKYANIDFSNIGKAAIEEFFSKSGMINDLVVGDGTITGKLVGVTITGDLIEGNTVKADKLVVKGSDGLYYKLNFEGGTFKEGEAVPTDSLHGSVITAKSVTAEKVSVNDLVAFDATIGGFTITDKSIYSGAKESVDNSTRGIYLDSDGQMAIGDSNNFIKFYKDQNGDYKLEISLVNTIKDEIENIEIGGRNLIRNSKNLIFDDYYFATETDAIGEE